MTSGPSWSKIMAFCSIFVIPALGIAYALIVAMTRLGDKIDNVQLKQTEQSFDIKDIRNDMNALKIQVDTITQRQKDYQRETQYRFMIQEHKK